MKCGILASECAALILACAAAAQAPANMAWTGVWQGQLDGQPSVTLTLADDGGTLGGTLVLDLIEHQEDGQARVAAIETHVLLRPQTNASTLSFEVMRRRHSDPPMHFTVTLDGNSKAHIHCLNCGPDAPVAELAKEQ